MEPDELQRMLDAATRAAEDAAARRIARLTTALAEARAEVERLRGINSELVDTHNFYVIDNAKQHTTIV